MQILPRLRYVIEICHPSDVTISNCVSVLIRIAQHDTESSWKIMECPRLTDVLYSLLKTELKNLHVALMVVRLFRSLCQAGKEISKKIVSSLKSLENTKKNFEFKNIILIKNMKQQCYFI